MATKEQNLGFLDNATSTLDQIATNPSTPRNIRKNIADIIKELKSDKSKVKKGTLFNILLSSKLEL